MAKDSGISQKCGDQCFVPSTVSVRSGTIVIWKNSDSLSHTASEVYGSFDTGILKAGETRSMQISSGNYQYNCIIHPWNKGTVVVDDPSVPLTPLIPPEKVNYQTRKYYITVDSLQRDLEIGRAHV